MSRGREARRIAQETRRMDRRWTIGVCVLLVAIAASGFSDFWADRFDGLIDGLGGGSTEAAFVGWLAGHAVLMYLLLGAATWHRWPNLVRRTWPIGVLLISPFLALRVSRFRRSAEIETQYWYLGSFHDTYGAALLTIVVAGGLGLLCMWQSSRGDAEDLARAERWSRASVRVPLATLALGTVGSLVWAFTGF